MTLWSAYEGNSAFGVDNVPHGASQALMPDGNHVLAGLRARDGTAGRRPPWCRVKWCHTGSIPSAVLKQKSWLLSREAAVL